MWPYGLNILKINMASIPHGGTEGGVIYYPKFSKNLSEQLYFNDIPMFGFECWNIFC